MPERRALDQGEQKWLQEKWYKIDSSGDGVLDHAELSVFMDSLKTGLSEAEKVQAFHDIDADGTGAVEVCLSPDPQVLLHSSCTSDR